MGGVGEELCFSRHGNRNIACKQGGGGSRSAFIELFVREHAEDGLATLFPSGQGFLSEVGRDGKGISSAVL